MRLHLLAFLLCCSLPLFSQENGRLIAVHLADGSILKARHVETGTDGKTVLTLSDGSLIAVITQHISWVSEFNPKVRLFPGGRKITERGGYTSLNFHLLSGKTTGNFEEQNRWGYGFHWSKGYRIFPQLALGAGLGLDAHEFYFLPAFVEVKGYFLNTSGKKNPDIDMSDTEWFGSFFDRKNAPNDSLLVKNNAPKQKMLFTYGFQFGYNFPLENLINNTPQEDARGGYLAYPSVGLLFPSKSDVSFRMDIGYKFQRYQRIFDQGWGYQTIDSISLKSFALRMGWEF